MHKCIPQLTNVNASQVKKAKPNPVSIAIANLSQILEVARNDPGNQVLKKRKLEVEEDEIAEA
jgi:hypothetical protein